jgi:G3E family GTPase
MSASDTELIPDLVEDLETTITYQAVPKAPPPSTSGAIIEEDKSKRVPVTILTGYLGSGKSTLLEQIAKRGDRKLAVILNEFGDSIDIEKSLTVKDKDNEVEEWLDLGNGCLCCTVKDTGVAAIERLVAKKSGFDHIILETTGLADPGPITTMFWLDDGLLSNVYIDGVVTVLDAANIEKCLEDKNPHSHGNDSLGSGLDSDLTVAHVQIALADVILLNKIDTVPSDVDIERITSKVRAINANVPVHTTQFGDIALEKILDLHAYEARNVNDLVRVGDAPVHDHRIGTKTFNFRKLVGEEEFAKFEKFLQSLLWVDVVEGLEEESSAEHQEEHQHGQGHEHEHEHVMEIHRLKGLIFVDNFYKVIQGVRATYDIIDGVQPIEEIELEMCRLVAIGKYIDEKVIKAKFKEFMGFEIESNA